MENFIFCAVTFTKKENSSVQSVIVKEGKKIFKAKEVVVKRILINCKSNTFITLKYHKPNFQNNSKVRVLNPAKNELGRISKHILHQITSDRS